MPKGKFFDLWNTSGRPLADLCNTSGTPLELLWNTFCNMFQVNWLRPGIDIGTSVRYLADLWNTSGNTSRGVPEVFQRCSRYLPEVPAWSPPPLYQFQRSARYRPEVP